MQIMEKLTMYDKLSILTDAAKYDVACTSSGTARNGDGTGIGNCSQSGICHSFSADGRCISLLKILFTNECIYDCKYCVNRSSNDVVRTSFTPDEICELTMEFYRRNYIEGLFLSSGIVKSPNYTMSLIYAALYKLRHTCNFQGYIHVKAIPGTEEGLIHRIGFLADRMSVNMELPTAESLRLLAPHKTRKNILTPMRLVQNRVNENKQEIALAGKAGNLARFVPAGQSTQMIIGATPESDFQIIKVAESLYQKFDLKRVFYSAFIQVNEDRNLPAVTGEGPPLLREHRLYQADWLLRYYNFAADELLDESNPNFNVLLDPKCNWALKHLEYFPVEVNHADYNTLLRVPGIGYRSAKRIVQARRMGILRFEDLKKIGVVLKRALYFITCEGRLMYPVRLEEDYILRNLLNVRDSVPDSVANMKFQQISLFDDVRFREEQFQVLPGEKRTEAERILG
ncbi:putative DNA modification/repair radical SAM protein [Hespellia stercorisuis]|uniref:Putative DNA modification/repair radical SAM protein n=1 Tax=Hespellia stercorisuis DSM 15480 TaxID=1121950 RepID=A0A1M6PGL5_9FIRM|nr:putative DNA modification/repair radical SAM protein [Hespellia stercorisuis]SHK07095.1 putative DNA modification/repair radical SAM protein [Hespellia stercorisuis DSM 15480]